MIRALGIRPVIINARLLWLRFKRDTMSPLAPSHLLLPVVMRIRDLESERAAR